MWKVGFIGFGNHARRLHEYIDNILYDYELICYHPNKNDGKNTNNLDTLFACDLIFITSPNDTHFKYIMKILKYSDAKIFCEKPPCVNFQELGILKSISTKSMGRIFFNFNYRYSELSKALNKSQLSKSIGRLVYVSGILSHGLAFKKGYEQSWRGNYPSNKSVVLDTSLIHLIDLFNYNLDGLLEIQSCAGATFSHGIDSFGVNFTSKHGANISLHSTYAAPYSAVINIFGTNGLMQMDGNKLCVRSPRDTFDKEGLFTTPPIVSSKAYSFEKDYSNSLRKAVDLFISTGINKNNFDKLDFVSSLQTIEIVLKCEEHLSH